MKKILTLIIAFGIQNFCNAQMTFQNTYGGNATDEGVAVVCVANGYVVAGNTTNSSTGKDIDIFKTDLLGNVSWSKSFGGNGDDVVYAMKKTIDGGFIIAGETKSFPTSGNDTSNAFLIKVDNSGNILWSHQYGGSGRDAAFAVTETKDSGFVATGLTNSFGSGHEDVLIFRVDKNGGQTWKEAIGGTGSDIGRAVTPTASGNAFIITGSTNGFSAVGTIVYTIRVEGNGTFGWSKMYDFYISSSNRQRIGYALTVNGNNEYILAGKIGMGNIGDAQAFAMSMDSTGTIINWSNYYSMNSGDGSAHSIEKDSSGGYIVGCTMGNYYPAIMKIDNAGNRLWDKYYSDATFSPQGFGNCSTVDANHQYITTGYSILPSTTDTSIILIKSDSTGGTLCNSFGSFITGNTHDSVIVTAVLSSTVYGGNDNAIIFTSNSSLIPSNTYCNSGIAENNLLQMHFIFSPNPMSTSAILSTDENISSGTILRVFDCFGRVVIEKQLSNNQTKIQRDNLASGIYFYSVVGKSGILANGKFIVE